jgi:hypothetical protein
MEGQGHDDEHGAYDNICAGVRINHIGAYDDGRVGGGMDKHGVYDNACVGLSNDGRPFDLFRNYGEHGVGGRRLYSGAGSSSHSQP